MLNAKRSLRILDIEHSVLISDESVTALSQLSQLTQLSMAKTKLSTEAEAQIILSLPQLLTLPRGDFLCDALGRLFTVNNLQHTGLTTVYIFQTGSPGKNHNNKNPTPDY